MSVAYDHIAQNKRKTWLIAVLFPICFSVLAYLAILFCHWIWLKMVLATKMQELERAAFPASPLFYYTNEMAATLIPIIAVLAIIWLILAYFLGADAIIGKSTAQEVTPESDRKLYRMVENLCATRGLPVPKIYVMPDKALNAFATGRDPEHAVIAITAGLLETLDKPELQSVIAHELAHIENRDITLMLLIVEGIALFTFFGEMLLKTKGLGGIFLRNVNAAPNSAAAAMGLGALVTLVITIIATFVGLIFTIFGYVIAPILRFAVSRQREFLADATSALTTRNPGALIKALEKISQNSEALVLRRHPSMSAMCIYSPQKIEMNLFNRISGLYASHPPISERIAMLKKMDGVM